MKRIHIAVRDFALPVPRIGSIEVNSGYDLLPQGGDEAHRIAQQSRASSIHGYKTEVKLNHSFEHRDHVFIVGGRIDGLIEAAIDASVRKSGGAAGHPLANGKSPAPIVIEEIKTAFDAHQLRDKLQATPTHPYCLQLQTYAYLYALENGVTPLLSFHLVSYVTGVAVDMVIPFDSATYERWLEKRLDELIEDQLLSAREQDRRQRLGNSVTFPFEQPRPGQSDLIDTIQRTLPQGDALMLQAPTGLGKTAGVIFPMLKDSLSRSHKLIYVTPKNTQHVVAQDAIKRMQTDGHAVRTLTLTAKSKICFKDEPICDPLHCEFARDYYAKVHSNDLTAKAAEYKNMDVHLFRALGEQYEVCPFELSLDSIPFADVIIGDYNYVFSPRGLISRFTDPLRDAPDKPNLVIDEAHNLPSRATDYYSPAISTAAIHGCKEKLESLPMPLRMDGAALLQRCKGLLLSLEPRTNVQLIDVSTVVESFCRLNAELSTYMSRYLVELAQPKSGDPIVSLCHQWSAFCEMLVLLHETEVLNGTAKKQTAASVKPRPGAKPVLGAVAATPASANGDSPVTPARFFATAARDGDAVKLKITCCDASPELALCLKQFEHVVAFSATLKPFEYYRDLSGFSEDSVQFVEFGSPFPKEHRKLLVIPQVSTKFSDREKNYGKIAEAIKRIVPLCQGNYFVFFPSFAFLRRVFDMVHIPGFRILCQDPGMSQAEVQNFMELLRKGSEPTVIFAVQGGVFSEGVDYPGDMIIGAIIVGPALPGFDVERELIREYYEQKFGNGFDFAYTFPGMARVVQAAGRVIRSPEDTGIVVLMDRRFTLPSYTQTMPRDWFDDSVGELVSESIVGEIEEFWRTKKAPKRVLPPGGITKRNAKTSAVKSSPPVLIEQIALTWEK